MAAADYWYRYKGALEPEEPTAAASADYWYRYKGALEPLEPAPPVDVDDAENPLNLLSNGNFNVANGTTGWTAAVAPATTISRVSPGRLRVSNDDDSNGIGLQAATLEIGVNYTFSFLGFQGTGDGWGYIIADSTETPIYVDTSFTGDDSVSVVFEATDTTMFIGLVNLSDNGGEFSDFDFVLLLAPVEGGPGGEAMKKCQVAHFILAGVLG
jgi:hypothetical protein